MDKYFSLTNQFKYCPNAFRIDTYEGCSYGCKYCFANNRAGGFSKNRKNEAIEYEYMKKFFDKAFESEKEYKDITIELMQHKVPLHLGGMADPFQHREYRDKMTFALLEMTNKYHYPVMISTKTASLPDEYWEILNPDIHAFQISLIGYSDEFIRKYETNTPLASERIAFIKELHNRGFWVSVRIQPLINLDEAIRVVKEVNGYVNYITVEHLKIPTDNFAVRELFTDIKEKYPFVKPKKSRNYELTTKYKLKNVNKIKEIAQCPVGCADNDLHAYSDSKCCCGVDCINDNFNNYLKYNTCYFDVSKHNKEEVNKEDLWIPKNSCKKCMHGDYAVKDLYHINEYVDKYIEETVGTPYKIDENTLLKEIGYWYGNYSEEDGLYIIDNGIEKFTYTNVRDGLKDWLSTLKQDVDTDWKNEIEFIEGLK